MCDELFSLCILCCRPLEGDLSAAMSEPKRAVPESFITTQDLNTSSAPKQMPSLRSPPAVSETPLDSPADLFQSEVRPEKPQSRKRKEVEEDIQMEELESIMSMDIDGFDDILPSNQSQQEQLKVHALAKQNHGTGESSSKRQRISRRENGTSRQTPEVDLKNNSNFQQDKREQSEQSKVSIKTEPLQVTENLRNIHESSKPGTSKNTKPFEDAASFIEVTGVLSLLQDTLLCTKNVFFFFFYPVRFQVLCSSSFVSQDEELLQVPIDIQPEDETKVSVKPVVIKQEVQVSPAENQSFVSVLLQTSKNRSAGADC